MVASTLAVKNKPSKRGEERREGDEIEHGNSSKKQENSRPVIERIPLIAIFFPRRRINWLLFVPQLRERCVNAISTRLSSIHLNPRNPVIALLPKPYNSRNLFIYLFILLSLAHVSIRRSKEAKRNIIDSKAVNRSPFDHPFFISLTNFKQSLAISRGRKRGGPSSIGRSPVRRWPKGSTLAIA